MTIRICAKSCRLLCLFTLIAFAFRSATAQTTTGSTSVAGGTLSWTASEDGGFCTGSSQPTSEYMVFAFSSFQFVIGGVTYELSGIAFWYQDTSTNTTGCPTAGARPTTLTLPSPAGFYGTCQISFTPTGSDQAFASLSSSCGTSIYDPDYKVVTLIYAPPGNKSSAGLTTSSSNGTTTTMGNTFTNGSSVSFTGGVIGDVGAGFGVTKTKGNTHTFTETFTNSAGISIGSQSTNPNAINHDQDLFAIWLNPEVTVSSNGSVPLNYIVATQPASNGVLEDADIVEVSAVTMEANAAGVTAVPLSILEPQTDPATGGVSPGLGAICKNNAAYFANTCTQANQCGCVPSDFAAILALDPLLNFSGTTNPMNADTSGPTACASPTASDSCRYIPVPISTGSPTQVTALLEGPNCQGCDAPTNPFTQSDATANTQTLSESKSETVSFSAKVNVLVAQMTDSVTFTWTDNESSGQTAGTTNSQSVTLSSATVDCSEEISIYEDTIFHTFVFQQPTGNTSCP